MLGDNRTNMSIITVVKHYDELTANELYRIKSLTETALQKNKKMIFSVEVTPKSEYSNYIKVLDYLKQGEAKKIAIVN